MMTQEQIIGELAKLPVKERRELFHEVVRVVYYDHEEPKFRQELSRENRRGIALALSGTFKPEGRYMPRTKEEDREVVMEYLEEK